MPKTPKLIVAKGSYEVYRAGHVLIIQKDGEFHCNLRKADNGFGDPERWVDTAIRCDEEAVADSARVAEARRAAVADYLVRRAEREARSPQFQF